MVECKQAPAQDNCKQEAKQREVGETIYLLFECLLAKEEILQNQKLGDGKSSLLICRTVYYLY